MDKLYKYKKAETLVEVTVSLGILAIVITSIYSAMILSNRLVFSQKYRTKATALASEGSDVAFDYIKRCNGVGNYVVNSTRNGLDVTTLITDPRTQDLPDISGTEFGRYITIEEIPSEKTLKVTTYVDWRERGVRDYIEIESLVGPSK